MQIHSHISGCMPGLYFSKYVTNTGLFNKGIFDLSIMRRLIEYNPVITRIPESSPLILKRVWIIAVMKPAIAPAKNAAGIERNGFTPDIINTEDTAAPVVKLPSTVISGKSKILYVIKVPIAIKAYRKPRLIAPTHNSIN
jgi:hypothetical protein